jgi:hypothetical protein
MEGSSAVENINRATGTGLVEFFDYAEKKGLMKSATARSYKSAAVKVLAIEDEDVDVRTLDVDDHFDRFSHIYGHNYAPGSLGTYKARFKSGIDMYLDYLNDPQSFKAPTRVRRPKRSYETTPGQRANSEAIEHVSRDQNIPETDDLLSYPFPLRSGKIAHLRLPPQLSSEDAERMAAFLKSLTIDPPMQLTAGERNE